MSEEKKSGEGSVEEEMVEQETAVRETTFKGISPGEMLEAMNEGGDALEDPEQLKTLDYQLILNIFQGRAERLAENRKVIWAAVSNAGILPGEAWLAEVMRLNHIFRIHRDEAVLAIYKRELERRLEVGCKLAAAVKKAREGKAAAEAGPAPTAPLSGG
jgi:hypothetical protein